MCVSCGIRETCTHLCKHLVSVAFHSSRAVGTFARSNNSHGQCIMPFMLTPAATNAADPAAALTARGASPELMTGQDDTFMIFNKYITPNVGPNGEVGFPEETAEVLMLNLLRPTVTVDDQGMEVGLYTHGMKADALERIWRRAETDGFDTSPSATKVESLLRLR